MSERSLLPWNIFLIFLCALLFSSIWGFGEWHLYILHAAFGGGN